MDWYSSGSRRGRPSAHKNESFAPLHGRLAVQPNTLDSPEPVRCAIYTRKSTHDGLEQDFNSLDAQRECAEAYILSQRHERWTALDRQYDDGGFTGANIDRPALKQILADVEAGLPDCVVVYK